VRTKRKKIRKKKKQILWIVFKIFTHKCVVYVGRLLERDYYLSGTVLTLQQGRFFKELEILSGASRRYGWSMNLLICIVAASEPEAKGCSRVVGS
jgi:hypothetical protein